MVSDEQRNIDKEIDTLLPFGLCLQSEIDQDHFHHAQRSLGWDLFRFHSISAGSGCIAGGYFNTSAANVVAIIK